MGSHLVPIAHAIRLGFDAKERTVVLALVDEAGNPLAAIPMDPTYAASTFSEASASILAALKLHTMQPDTPCAGKA